MEEKHIDEIVLAKLSDVELSPEEETLFGEWYSHPENRSHYARLMREQAAAFAAGAKSVDAGAAWTKLRPRQRLSMGRRVARYAAAVIVPLCLGVTAYYLAAPTGGEIAHNIAEPGEFKALLTLSTGEQIALSQHVESLSEEGVSIANDVAEGLTYTSQTQPDADLVLLNTVFIPRGGFYKVALADGTVVWLNSESQLRYPVAFAGKTRTVELQGEAYFIVAPDRDKPFIVTTPDCEVRVTGTQFNVRSYNEGVTATTLVEGSVDVEVGSQVRKLTPNQQAVVRNSEIEVENVDVTNYVAWHKGEFSFSLDNLEDIMDELSRWYDVEVTYEEPQLRNIRFSAGFSRDTSLEEIIGILEKTEKIDFILEGRTIKVKKR